MGLITICENLEFEILILELLELGELKIQIMSCCDHFMIQFLLTASSNYSNLLAPSHLTIPSCDWRSCCLFSCQVVSKSLQPHGLQHARPTCPSPPPQICPSSCPLNQWCHLIVSSSVTLFSFCLQSFPASGSFPMSQLFAFMGGHKSPYCPYSLLCQALLVDCIGTYSL